MTKPKVAFFNAKLYDKEFFNRANLKHQVEISYFEDQLNLETCHLARRFYAVCVFVNDLVTAPIIDTLSKEGVKLIALRSTGYNHVDLKAAYKKITVVRASEYSPYSVAEFAVGMMLSLNRKIHLAHLRVEKNNFSIDGLLGFDMHGKTAGIIGAGHIGAAVIQILKGFGMKVIAYDIDADQVKKAGCTFSDLDVLYKQSDIISLHCFLTAENTHMIDKESIAKMKNGAMLINTARGGLINTRDLIAALESGKIGAAGLDVYENEGPYFYRDLSMRAVDDEILARLQMLPSVLLSSHQAFFTKEALNGIANTTLQNVQDFFQGKPLKNEVRYSP